MPSPSLSQVRNKLWGSLMLAILASWLAGCDNYLVFVTATKFGLDVSQVAEQPPKVLLGYKREETIIIPAKHENANIEQDTHAVLGHICVMANPSLWDFIQGALPGTRDVPDGLQVKSIFATGMAARSAAENPKLKEHFIKSAFEKSKSGKTEKQCF